MSKDEAFHEFAKQVAQKAEIAAEHYQGTIAAEAIHLVRNYQGKIVREIKALHQLIQSNKDSESAPSFDQLKQNILSRIDHDINIIEEFNQIISSIPKEPREVKEPNSGKTIKVLNTLESVRTNKILPSLLYAQQFIEDNFEQLYEGKDIDGYNFEKPEVLNSRGYNESNIWGSAKSVQYQYALFYIAMTITNKSKFADIDLGLYKENLHFADEAAIAHIEPLPETIQPALDKIGIKDCSLYFADDKTPLAILTIPGGFTFGGGVGSARNPRILDKNGNRVNKEQPSHDGPTFVADACKLDNAFHSTSEQYYIAYQISSNNQNFIGKEYNTEIVEKFDPVKLEGKDPQKILTGNEIHIIRAFKADDQNPASVGTGGGQVSIPLGISNNGVVAALATNRAIDIPADKTPKENLASTYVGYGIERRFVGTQEVGSFIHKPGFSRFNNKGLSR